MKEERFSLGSLDLAKGAVILNAWSMPDVPSAQTYADTFRACVSLLFTADSYVLQRNAARQLTEGGAQPPPGDWFKNFQSPTLGDKLQIAREIDASGNPGLGIVGPDVRVAPVYEAALYAVRSVYRHWRRVSPDSVLILPGAAEVAGNPWALVVAVVGVAAAAGLTWWGTDANEKAAEVAKLSAGLAAQTDQYIRDLQIRVAAGAPLPPPPPPLDKTAYQERSYNWWIAGAGVLAGGALAYAGYRAFSGGGGGGGSRAMVPARSNPSPRRRASARKALPAPRRRRRVRINTPCGVRSAVDRTKPKRKPRRSKPRRSNPIRSGYSRATIRANVRKLIREGKPADQAAAIALEEARRAYRERHPSGPLPAYLRKPKRRATAATARRLRRKNPAKKASRRKTSARRTRKRSAATGTSGSSARAARRKKRARSAKPTSSKRRAPVRRTAKRRAGSARAERRASGARRKNASPRRARSGRKRAGTSRSTRARAPARGARRRGTRARSRTR